MTELKGTKTEANLKTAFGGECMAWARYAFYEEKAKAEGYEQIAEIFKITGKNEKAHAELWFKVLNCGIPTTDVNLGSAAENENYEYSQMYSSFAATAKEEGFAELSALFEKVGKIEKSHKERYEKLLDNINKGKVYSKDSEEVWVCRNCGYEISAKDAPDSCPVCGRPKAYFEEKAENY